MSQSASWKPEARGRIQTREKSERIFSKRKSPNVAVLKANLYQSRDSKKDKILCGRGLPVHSRGEKGSAVWLNGTVQYL